MYKNLLRVITVLVFAAGGQVALALTYSFTDTFSGTTPVGGSSWGQLSFSDMHGGGVLMTISLPLTMSPTEFVTEFDFNYNPNKNPANLLFTRVTNVNQTNPPRIALQANDFRADGSGGYFDVSLRFPTSGSDDREDAKKARFQGGDQVTYKITGNGVTASDFAFRSVDKHGNPVGYYAVLHMQGIPGERSAWVAAIPEPENYVLMLAGLGIVGFMARRRMRHM